MCVLDWLCVVYCVLAGMGNFVQTLVMVMLMAAFQQTASEGLSPEKLIVVWRLQYGLVAAVLLVLTVYRLRHLKESNVWQSASPLILIDDMDESSLPLITKPAGALWAVCVCCVCVCMCVCEVERYQPSRRGSGCLAPLALA